MKILIPPEFVEVARGALVRRGLEAEARLWLGGDRERKPSLSPTRRLDTSGDDDRAALREPRREGALAPAGPAAESGRGGARSVVLDGGGRAWLRWYRHGGLLRRLLGDVYWQQPPRPWRELVATEAARRAGVLAPEVLAAAAVPIGSGRCRLYRALLVTRDLPDRRSLAGALRTAASADERGAWIDHAWEAVERLHAGGVRHPDLNASNLLVAGLADPVAVIDFDRAVAGPHPVGALGRAMARRRFSRSVAKLGLPGLERRQVARRIAGRHGDERR